MKEKIKSVGLKWISIIGILMIIVTAVVNYYMPTSKNIAFVILYIAGGVLNLLYIILIKCLKVEKQ